MKKLNAEQYIEFIQNTIATEGYKVADIANKLAPAANPGQKRRMEREYRNAIARAIKASALNGYKWTITDDGLRWSYFDLEFTFYYDAEKGFFQVFDDNDDYFVGLLVGDHSWDDAKNLEEAYYKATLLTISEANYLY